MSEPHILILSLGNYVLNCSFHIILSAPLGVAVGQVGFQWSPTETHPNRQKIERYANEVHLLQRHREPKGMSRLRKTWTQKWESMVNSGRTLLSGLLSLIVSLSMWPFEQICGQTHRRRSWT